VKAPTRALVVEDIEAWVYTLDRAARRAGASEVVVCENLQMVRDALRSARFDVAILDIGLDPDDDLNSDGVKALEAIREMDGGGTRCILVTGWQGGDRMSLQADAQQKFGVDWAYMKEKYEAHEVIAKLTELLEQASERRLSLTTPMTNLCAKTEQFYFEGQLLDALSPKGGAQTLYSLASRLLGSAIPLIAMNPAMPMEKGPDGVWIGVYWSRALATAVAVGLAPAVGRRGDESNLTTDLERLLPVGMIPDLIESVRERNIQGRLWELPGLDRDTFPG
jgi:ActR/RegA family two-component response regulator